MFAFTFYFQGMLVCLLVICSNKKPQNTGDLQ